MERQMKGWTGRWMDGEADGWMERQMKGWTDANRQWAVNKKKLTNTYILQ